MQRTLIGLAVLMHLGVSGVPSVSAGMTYEHYLALHGKYAVITMSSYDVLVVSVAGTSGPGTNGTPPLVHLVVEDVLRGPLDREVLPAIWAPFPHDIDCGGGDSEQRLAHWNARELLPPIRDTRWIVIGEMLADSSRYYVPAIGRFSYSEEERTAVTEAVAGSEESYEKALVRELEARASDRRAIQENQDRDVRVAELLEYWFSDAPDKPSIGRLCESADLIGVGRYGWHVSTPVFAFIIEQILKGDLVRPVDVRRAVAVSLPPGAAEVFYVRRHGLEEQRFILFLDGGLPGKGDQMDRYSLPEGVDGMVPFTPEIEAEILGRDR